MAKNKQTYTLQIDAEIGNLENKLNSVKGLLSGVLGSANAPKGLEKAFEKIEGLIDKIKTKVAQPIDSKAGFSAISRDVDSAQVALTGLMKIVKSISSMSEADKISFLSPETQAQIEKVINSLTTYAQAMDAASAETEELVAAREKLADAEERVAAAQAKVNSRSANLEAAKAEQRAAEDGIRAIEERRRKLAELREEQERIEEFYNTPNEDGTRKNRSKKYDGVSARPQDIRREISELEAASAGDADALERYNNDLRSAKENVRSYQTQLNTATRALNDSTNAYNTIKEKVDELNAAFESNKPEAQQRAFAELRASAEALGISLEGISESYSESDANELIARITALKTKGLDRVRTAASGAGEELEDFGDSCKDIKGKIEAGTEALEDMNEAASQQKAFEDKIKSFLGIQGAAQLMRAALRDAMQTITELDATMANMAVVTDLDISDYWNQLPEYTQRANKLGLAIGDVYKADTLFYQQGLKTNEVVAISTETMKMAAIAGLDTAEATDRMTAALRGFNMELNEASAQTIADVYSELAAITAADVDEISTAMTKTASIASSAGMEFETTAAFLSQIIETTRESAETAGTAMKTVIARFQELKKSPDEIGEIDGEIVDANAIETALRSVGVSLRDANGQFRELDDVFLELSSKWAGLDKNTQRYIATIAAGSRQQSRFIAMMSDYGRTTELVAAANNSAGASQEQFEKKAESLEFKINQLKNAWHEFTMGIMESDLVKTGVEILTKFLEVINKATDGLGDKGVGGALMKIVSVFAIFKMGMKIFNKFEAPIMSLFKKVTKWAGIEGFKSGKTYAEAAEKGATSIMSDDADTTEGMPADDTVDGDKTKTSPKTLKGRLSDTIGFSNFQKAREASIEANRNRALMKDVTGREETQRSLSAMDEAYTFGKNGQVYRKGVKPGSGVSSVLSKEEAETVKKDYADLSKKAAEYASAEANYAKASKEKWDNISKGIGSAAAAMMGMGTIISMVGGALSAAGFEEAGEAISTFGQWIMVAGSILMAFVPILKLLGTEVMIAGTKMSIAGFIAQAGWWWVVLIVAGIAVLVTAVILIFNQIKNNSPEKKLEAATKNAEAAADAAERAKENYEALNESLDSLGDKQKELENLTRGTDEWNKAVQNVNSSVLDLIDKYPELANFVENEGGVLTLDVESNEVQAVLNDYEQGAVAAKGAAIGAKAKQNRAELDYDLDKMDDKIFEKFQTEGQGAATWTAIGNLAAATVVGAAGGAAIGAGTGALIGAAGAGVGAAPGAGVGAIVGAIAGGVAGLTVGIATFQSTVDQVEKSNETNRKNVKELAQAYANGETGETITEIAAYIERNGIAVGDAAEKMAKSLLEESETMLEFGQALNATDAAQKAYYQAMATNAQQLIDLGAHSEKQIKQMSAIVDEDLTKAYEDQRKTELQNMKDEKGQEAFNDAKADFVKQQYGGSAKIDGNKILDEKGEVIREFTDDDAWIAEMAAADATLQAAEAMQMVPDIINNNLGIIIDRFGVETQKAFEKAFSGEDLTKDELSQFEKTLGNFSYSYTDAEGNTRSGTVDDAWAALNANQQSIWGSKEAYARSLDKDYAGIKDLWENMSNEQKQAVYGGTDEAAYERFEETFTEILDAQTEAFSKADENIKSMLGETATYSKKLSSAAAQAWTNNLKDIYTAGEDIEGLNNELTQLLQGMSAEDANAAMAQINAIDKMSIGAWEDLSYVFENLGIEYSTEALNEFIEKGIEVSGAIRKIDFTTLANDINDTYKLLDKVKEGGRAYSEKDYRSLIAANKSLEKSFTKIGDEFIYTGGSMETLTDALQKNTIAVLQDANAQLKNKIEMGEIVKATSDANKLGSVEAMNNDQLENYLITMRSAFAESGKDLGSLGIEGLSMNTSFVGASTEDLKKWAIAIAQLGGSLDIFKEDYTEGLRQTNIQRYVRNDASYNAQMAVEGGEYADEHQEALILQAIQSGGVSNAMIEAYRKAIESGNKEEIEKTGKQIAEATEKIVEASEGRDAYQDLIERVTDAIIDARQEEIDKLDELNDSINTANDKLLSKIQQQINEERQARDNQKTEQNLEDLYNQRALLAAQTSAPSSELLAIDQQIAEAEESYQDTLVDQAIQNLQDVNEQAAEQRERQIALLEQQLQQEQDSGAITAEAEQIVKNGITEINSGVDLLSTKMGELLSKNELEGLSKIAGENWFSDLQQMSTMAADWLENQGVEKTNESGEILPDETEEERKAREAAEKAANIDKKKQEALQAGKQAHAARFSGTTADRNEKEQEIQDQREAYISAATEGITDSKKLEAARQSAGKEFDQKIDRSEIVTGSIDGLSPTGISWWHGRWDTGEVEIDGVPYAFTFDHDGHTASNQDELNQLVGGNPQDRWLVMRNNIPYIYWSGAWHEIDNNPETGTNVQYEAFQKAYKNKLNKTYNGYKTGGLADFTGPAWLDGTPSKPEYVLNAAQTERFFSFIDVLEGIESKQVDKKSTGDNYFDIEINVDKLENDYDVEQIANKIRRMITEDASYRNVNAINHIR